MPQPLEYASMDGPLEWWPGAGEGSGSNGGLFVDGHQLSPNRADPAVMESQTPLGNLLAQYDAFLTERSGDGTWMNLFNDQPAKGNPPTGSSSSLNFESPYAAADDALGWMSMIRTPMAATPAARRTSLADTLSPPNSIVASLNYVRCHGASAVVQGEFSQVVTDCRLGGGLFARASGIRASSARRR